MELKPIDIRDFFDVPNPGLTAYMKHVKDGSDDIVESPFYKGRSITSVMDEWSNQLDTLSSTYPDLIEFENSLREKVGPMSVQKPLEQRMDDIDHYYSGVSQPGSAVSARAVEQVIADFRPAHGLRRRNRENTINKMRLSTNSGSPFFTKRRRVIARSIKGIITEEMQYIENTGYILCAVIGWRGQEGGLSVDEVKQRVIWMMPFLLNVDELSVYQVFIEAMQYHNLIPAWISMDAVDYSITKLFDTKEKSQDIICTDFEKFDQHFNANMSNVAKQVLRATFTSGNLDNWLDTIFPIKYNLPLVLTEKLAVFGQHGMASGSGGTNCDETITHKALQHESAMMNDATLNPFSMCLGDDGCLTYPGITIKSVTDSYTQHGQVMNKTKQSASPFHCEYLRRWHNVRYRHNGICVGVYSTYRALGRMRYQERFYDPEIWGPKMVALRQLSILENVKWHPLCEKFAEFCMKGDRYRLGLDIPGFLNNIAREAKKATDVMPDFLGYTKLQMVGDTTGIQNWWIVRYLLGKR